MFKLRFLSFIVLTALFAFVFLSGSEAAFWLFAGFSVFLGYRAVYEYLDMVERKGVASYKLPACLMGVFIISAGLFSAGKLLVPAVSISVLVLWMIMFFNGSSKEDTFKKIIISASSLFMIILPLSFIPSIFCMKDGAAILLFLVIVTKSGDTVAYMTGTVTNRLMNGNHKIVPSISPKKSWEGTFGGLVCSVVLSLCFRGLLPFEFSFSVALLTGVLLFAGGFIGDLLESCMKRACGVKDSASIVPGMGGVLDILDSFLINAPLFYIFLNYGNI